MITVTDTARACLARLLEDGEVPPDYVLRLLADDAGSLALNLELPQRGDNVFSHEGRAVLAVEPHAEQLLDGKRLDAQATPDGLRLQPL